MTSPVTSRSSTNRTAPGVSSQEVGITTGWSSTPTTTQAEQVRSVSVAAEDLTGLQVLQRRGLPGVPVERRHLNQLMVEGGHVVHLGKDQAEGTCGL